MTNIAKIEVGDDGISRVVAELGDWRPYTVEFDTADGQFGFHLWAVSFAHAEMRLEELKESARITGVLEQMHPS